MAFVTCQPGSVFADDFTIVSPISEGAMGQVFLVEQRSTGKRRALKLMLPELVNDPRLKQRFEQEARIGARIPSEHVVEVVAAGIDGASGTPWLAMELLDGENLAAWRAKRSEPSSEEVRLLFEQLCHALGAAHDAGIVHRDLKPRNLFVARALHAGAPFTLKVLDFGIAKLVDDAATNKTAALGTPLWMAPEQTEASFGIGPASDVWALGLLAFWLLTGKYYWRSANDGSPTVTVVLREVVSDPIISASARAREYGCESRLPPGFDAWFARCVARESATRYQNARDVFAGLDPLLRTGANPAVGGSVFTVGSVGSGFGSPAAPSGPAFGAPSGFGPPPSPPGAFGAPPPQPGAFGQPFQAASPWGAMPPPPQRSNGPMIAVIAGVAGLFVVGLFVLIGAGVYLGFRSVGPSPVSTPVVVAVASQGPVPIDANDASWGDPQAPVTVVVFGEYECPYCGKLNTTLDQVKSQYGRQDVRIVWKHFPLDFHKNARPASIAAATVHALGGDTAYWSFHQSAMSDQRSLTDVNFARWAVAAGVNATDFNSAFAARTYERDVDDDIALGKRIGVKGTPAAFVNGVLVSGAQPLDKFSQVIDDQLREARAAIASGTPRERVYAELSERNYQKPAAAESKSDTKKVDTTTVWKVPVVDSPVRGPSDALVTIVLFSEYQCPFCQRVEGTLEKVREHYGANVRVVWKDRPLPFHKQAGPAAQFAREARKQKGDKGYWAAHDLLFDNNKRLTEADLTGYARQLGLNVADVQRAIRMKSHQRAIDADTDLADALEAKGTPTMFINGRQLRGAQPYEKFEEMIDDELRKAKSMVAAGTSRGSVYDKIMAGARAPGSDTAPERADVPPPSEQSPWKGASNGTIVVQVFADFQCPFCARLDPTLEQLIETYPGRVRVVWRHLPLSFHKDAMLAAEASVEVHRQKGNAGFWAFHDLLIKNQKALSRVDLEGYAEQVGVNLPAFRAALDDHRHQPVVERDAAIARAAGITGTPTSIVNGELVKGAQPFDKFRRVIDGMK